MADECSNCKYAYGPVGAGPDVGLFWCRRFPPREHHPEWHSGFPLVPTHGQWCGEYKHGAPVPAGGSL